MVTHVFEVLERDKLDDVAEDGLPLWRAQDPIVPVQDLHVREVGVSHADDDDGHGQVGGVHDGLARVCHVGDDAVGQDQQDEVLLRDGAEMVKKEKKKEKMGTRVMNAMLSKWLLLGTHLNKSPTC